MIGVGLVAFFLVINASIRASIDEALDDGFAGDFVVSSGDFGMVGLPTTVATDDEALPDVASRVPLRFAPAKVDGDDTSVDRHANTGALRACFDLDAGRGQRRPRARRAWSSPQRQGRRARASPSATR